MFWTIYGVIIFIISYAIVACLSYYAFYLREHRKDRYIGLWVTLAEIFVSLKRIRLGFVGIIAGSVIVLAMEYIVRSYSVPLEGRLLISSYLNFIVFAFLFVMLGLGLYRIDKRLKKLEEDRERQKK
jgi:hypothetical protein